MAGIFVSPSVRTTVEIDFPDLYPSPALVSNVYVSGVIGNPILRPPLLGDSFREAPDGRVRHGCFGESTPKIVLHPVGVYVVGYAIIHPVYIVGVYHVSVCLRLAVDNVAPLGRVAVFGGRSIDGFFHCVSNRHILVQGQRDWVNLSIFAFPI